MSDDHTISTLVIHREPVEQIVRWLHHSVGDDPGDPHTLPWRIAKISEEVGEFAEALQDDDKTAMRAELCDIIATTEVAALSLAPGSLPREIRVEWSHLEGGPTYLRRLTARSGRVSSALSGLIGRNPRKGVTHTPAQALGALHDLTAAAAGALAALTQPAGPQATLDNHFQKLVNRTTAPVQGRQA